MTKWFKALSMCLAVVLSVSMFAESSFANAASDDFEVRVQKARAALAQEEAAEQGRVEVQRSGAIKKLIELVFKSTSKTETVKATKNEIRTKLTGHAMQEAFIDGITSKMVDKILSGKSSGMLALKTYKDTIQNSRIIVDPNSKIVLVMDETKNTIITIYKDTGNAIINRPANGRWTLINWFYN
ncbi:hypothetical protein [Brevibacillus reuszeri]|nr:hypothetical protein [Brevibacillus reuszeri]KNB70201.1 hypothetical protein ADS79_14625 [Brevibacillus reuszeri]